MELKRVKNPSVVQQVIDSLTEAMIQKELSPFCFFWDGADELYEAHERIYQMLCEKDTGNLNECIRGTYFL